MQLSRWSRAALTDHLIPSPSSRPRAVICISNVIRQVTCGVPLSLADAARTQPVETIAAVNEMPVVKARLAERFKVVQCGAGPGGRSAVGDGVIVQRGTAAISPDGARAHELGGMGEEIVNGGASWGDRVQRWGGLVAVDEVKDVVGLGF